jgi:hyperosmotically inducible periplasmic protein
MKRILTVGLLLACTAVLGGCVAAVVGGAAAGGYYVGKDDRSAERIAADVAMTADVKTRLISEPGIRSFSINVDTYNAGVTLKGDVKTGAQRATAERIARRAKGVRSVRNELVVKG